MQTILVTMKLDLTLGKMLLQLYITKSHIEKLPTQEKSEIAANLVNRILRNFNFDDVKKIN